MIKGEHRNNHYIGDDGAKVLAEGLTHCPNLNLKWNGICNDGAKGSNALF